MQGIARATGTCGELVQGKIGQCNFLVTCPVEIYSVVKVKLNTTGTIQVDKNMPKVRRALDMTLKFLDRTEMGAAVIVSSSIPHGKGMASSTADITAACAATAAALGTFITPAEIAEIALSIEPTDGIMFEGITMFDHVQGKVARVLGKAPELDIVIVDLGGEVDTVLFNANLELDKMNRLKEHRIISALEKLERGLVSRDTQLIGEAATESAFANQHILYKPELEELYEICRKTGGTGVNVAHSGTVVGLLFESCRNLAGNAMRMLYDRGFRNVLKTCMLDGGVEVLLERAGEMAWQKLDAYMEETYGRLRKSTG